MWWHDKPWFAIESGELALGPQYDLIEAEARHTTIQHASTGQPLQLRRPGIGVTHVLAPGAGIAHRQYRVIGRHRILAAKLALGCAPPRPRQTAARRWGKGKQRIEGASVWM